MKFQTSLLGSGLSEEKYLELLGRDIIKDQITRTITESAKVSEDIIKKIASKNLEKRDGTIIDLILTPLSEINEPTESELRKFYDNTSKSWVEPTRRIGKYFYLDPKDYTDQIEISEIELIDEFDIRRSDYVKEETRSINQLIVDNENDANEIVERVKNGDEFESIIKEDFNNQNTVINDLKKSDLTEEIANAVFRLNLNEISSIIKSDLGYYVIKLDKIIPAVIPNFDEIKVKLKNDVKLERATDLVYDIANFADDEFSSGSSIDEVAKQKGIDIQLTEEIDREGLNKNKTQPQNLLFRDQTFLEVLWDDNSNEISINETTDGKFFALVVKDEINEFLPDFEEIKTKLKNAWKQTQAIEITLNLAGELSAAPDLINFANENQMKVSEVISASQNDAAYARPQIIKTLFGINKIGEKQIAVTDLGISVVRFDKVSQPSLQEVKNLAEILSTPFNQSLINDLNNALISKLGEQHKLEVNRNLILQALGLTSQ